MSEFKFDVRMCNTLRLDKSSRLATVVLLESIAYYVNLDDFICRKWFVNFLDLILLFDKTHWILFSKHLESLNWIECFQWVYLADILNDQIYRRYSVRVPFAKDSTTCKQRVFHFHKGEKAYPFGSKDPKRSTGSAFSSLDSSKD
jgi:hypothetical protein